MSSPWSGATSGKPAKLWTWYALCKHLPTQNMLKSPEGFIYMTQTINNESKCKRERDFWRFIDIIRETAFIAF